MAVAGNISAGKTTLVQLLAKRLGWQPFLERERENPYLSDFYKNMHAWSFHSQLFFLISRTSDIRMLSDFSHSVIQDRTIYEDAEVFAKNLYRNRFMTERDYRTYSELYQTLGKFLPNPDLLLYLHAPVATLLERIKKRGREYEMRIDADYIKQLNDLYCEWIKGFNLCPVLTIPVEKLNYVDQVQHLDLIVSKIHDKLAGRKDVSLELVEIG